MSGRSAVGSAEARAVDGAQTLVLHKTAPVCVVEDALNGRGPA